MLGLLSVVDRGLRAEALPRALLTRVLGVKQLRRHLSSGHSRQDGGRAAKYTDPARPRENSARRAPLTRSCDVAPAVACLGEAVLRGETPASAGPEGRAKLPLCFWKKESGS